MTDPTGTAGAPRRRSDSKARLLDLLQQHERTLSVAMEASQELERSLSATRTGLQMVQKSLANLRQALEED